MLVDINLLPKKEPRNLTLVLIIIASLLLTSLAAFYFYWQTSTLNKAIDQADNDINLRTELLTIEQRKLADMQSINEVESLEEAIEWTAEQRNDYKFIINELTKALPERGFVYNFNLNNDDLGLTLQFDTSSEAAYYLDRLLEFEWIEEALLTGRTSREVINEDEESGGIPNAELMPRYIANYTVTVDLLKVKELTGIIDLASEDEESSTSDGREE